MTGSTPVDARVGDAGIGTPAALLTAVADPTRWAVLRHLSAGKACVCELQDQVAVAPNLLSYHLRVLREAGLVVATKRGRWVDYVLAPDALPRVIAALPLRAAAQEPR